MTPAKAARTWWCEHAWLPTGVAAGVRLTVTDGRFSAIETGCPTPRSGDTHLPGVTLPGLANAHSHAFHRALRGRTHGDGGTFWTWRQQMYAVASRLRRRHPASSCTTLASASTPRRQSSSSANSFGE